MLAIFNNSVAARPDTFRKPHNDSVSAVQYGFLVKEFMDAYPASVVSEIGSSAVIAYSLFLSDNRLRFQFGAEGDTYCVYQGSTNNLETLVNKYGLNSRDDDEVSVIIQAFRILQEATYQTPPHVLLDLLGDFSFIFYNNSSNLLFFTDGCSSGDQLYWGIDSESSLIICHDEDIVRKACVSATQRFPIDEVYISRRGRGGLEAIFEPLETTANMKTSDSDTLDQVIEKWIRWQAPPSPFVKINTQGLVFPHDNMIGIGVVIRNSLGKMVLAGSKKIKGIYSQKVAEHMANVESLALALKAGLKDVILESGFGHGKNSAFSKLFEMDMLQLGSMFSKYYAVYIKPNANKAACGLAEYAKDIEDCIIWAGGEIPECIASIIDIDSKGFSQHEIGFVPLR